MAFSIAPDAYAYLAKQARQIVAGSSRALPNDGHLTALIGIIDAQAATIADLQRTLSVGEDIKAVAEAFSGDDAEAALSTGMGDVEVPR